MKTSKYKWHLLLTVLIVISALTYVMFYPSKTSPTSESTFITEEALFKAIPINDVQVVLKTQETSADKSNKLYDSIIHLIPLYEDILQQVKKSKPSNAILCALQINANCISPLYLTTKSNDATFYKAIRANTNSQGQTVMLNDISYKLYPLLCGGMIGVYDKEGLVLASTNIPLLEKSIQTYANQDEVVSSTDLYRLLQQAKSSPNNYPLLYKLNFIPLGRDKVTSLEDWSKAEWAVASLDITPQNLEISTTLPAKENSFHKSDSNYVIQLHDKAIFAELYSKEEVIKRLNTTPESGYTLYELYWSQSLTQLLSKSMDRVTTVETFADSITLSQEVLSIPIDTMPLFKNKFHQLLADNKKENKLLLDEETLDNNWQTEALPLPASFRNILNASRDQRVLYCALYNSQFLAALNNTTLQAYIRGVSKKDQLVDQQTNINFEDSDVGIYGELQAILKDSSSQHTLLPSFLFASSIVNPEHLNVLATSKTDSNSVIFRLTLAYSH